VRRRGSDRRAGGVGVAVEELVDREVDERAWVPIIRFGTVGPACGDVIASGAHHRYSDRES
jgi:hypothetical protein